jgi:hypothetical protein
MTARNVSIQRLAILPFMLVAQGDHDPDNNGGPSDGDGNQ